MTSPWQHALGDRFSSLHPNLVAYFGAIPEGSVGVGAGVFDRIGSPRLWLWPALFLLGRQGVVYPTWRRGVPFTLRNHPTVDGYGNDAIIAFRTIGLRRGDRRMLDAITAERHGLVDYLGDERRWVARLTAVVVGGELHLSSTSLAVRIGRFRVRIPARWAPVVSLVERFDDETGRQQVSLTIDSPVFGRLYEYAGSFTYAVLEGP